METARVSDVAPAVAPDRDSLVAELERHGANAPRRGASHHARRQ